jgi:nucleoside 2-deoxyribosyltransferase
VCERIDKEAYVGDIMSQVKARIGRYHGMLALLNDANPNVFLEIGYAWAKDKPTVLMVKKGQTLPFDITGQKCIVYSNITDLRNRLKAELKGLIANGTLANPPGG